MKRNGWWRLWKVLDALALLCDIWVFFVDLYFVFIFVLVCFVLFNQLNPCIFRCTIRTMLKRNSKQKSETYRKKCSSANMRIQFESHQQIQWIVHHYYLLPFNFLVLCFFIYYFFFTTVNLINIMSDKHSMINLLTVLHVYGNVVAVLFYFVSALYD